MLQEYADFCLDWGRTLDAIKILQAKLSLYEVSFKSRLKTVGRLKEIQTNKETIEQKCNEYLKKLEQININ
jgi:hypothetical protein